jgi:hypothetical protein
MAMAGKVGAVYASRADAAPVPFTNEATTPDAVRKRYQVTDPDCRYWDPETPVTVRVDGDIVSAGFTLEGAGGFVVFDEAQDSKAVVTVSGSALSIDQAGGFFNWSIDAEVDEEDATTFESGGWKEYEPILKGWSGSAEAFWGDKRFFESLGKVVVVKLFVDAGPSQTCLEGYAIITAEGVEASVNALVQQSIDFRGVGPLCLRGFEE